jgi:hypothetical protein
VLEATEEASEDSSDEGATKAKSLESSGALGGDCGAVDMMTVAMEPSTWKREGRQISKRESRNDRSWRQGGALVKNVPESPEVYDVFSPDNQVVGQSKF